MINTVDIFSIFLFQSSQEETLAALENLLTEFFDGATSNERKRSIGNKTILFFLHFSAF